MNGKPFNIGGYSFGACVAFEMTRQLENNGKSPISLTLLDGSHSYVAAIIYGYKSKMTSTKEQYSEQILGEVEALVLFTLQLYPADVSELRIALLSQKSWSARLEYVSSLINKVTTKKMKKAVFTIEEVNYILNTHLNVAFKKW